MNVRGRGEKHCLTLWGEEKGEILGRRLFKCRRDSIEFDGLGGGEKEGKPVLPS